MDLKEKLEEWTISDNCSINTYISYDEQNYILEINYMDGRFISEKLFPNNQSGVARMEELKHRYKCEEDVRKYFELT